MFEAQWIPVEKMLPLEYDYVLISYISTNNPNLRYVPSVGMYRRGSWTTKESSAEPAAKHGDFERNYNVKVTHWMPLPDSPK